MQRSLTKRVLVIFPGALGDLICGMPAVAAIARQHRGASIELMARGELARLAVGRTVVARGYSIDAREVGALFADEPSDNARSFFSQFDRIYSFFASDNVWFRGRLSAATDAEVSFHPFRPDREGHVSEAYLRAIGEAGASIGSRLEPTADDLATASRVLAQSGCGGSDLIVMFPGSGSAAKNWPAEKFAALAAMLKQESEILSPLRLQNDKGARQNNKDTSIAVVLGPAEADLEPIFRDAGVPLLKDLDLPTVAGIARMASAFVGNDSGVSHLAAAVGAPGVVIFGPTDPARWRPLGSHRGQRVEILRRDPIESVDPSGVTEVLFKICRATANIID
jgi:ADP-heptose:LPS heptosyltransferase